MAKAPERYHGQDAGVHHAGHGRRLAPCFGCVLRRRRYGFFCRRRRCHAAIATAVATDTGTDNRFRNGGLKRSIGEIHIEGKAAAPNNGKSFSVLRSRLSWQAVKKLAGRAFKTYPCGAEDRDVAALGARHCFN
jgi:hypothetical protein